MKQTVFFKKARREREIGGFASKTQRIKEKKGAGFQKKRPGIKGKKNRGGREHAPEGCKSGKKEIFLGRRLAAKDISLGEDDFDEKGFFGGGGEAVALKNGPTFGGKRTGGGGKKKLGFHSRITGVRNQRGRLARTGSFP